MRENCERLTEPPNAGDADDRELLRQYAATGAETAFARLVEHHVDLVYSAAFRQMGNHAMAQDVSQAVFIILARKAASLRQETVLAGWLVRAVRYAALDARKIEARRQAREQEVAQMQLTDCVNGTASEWEQLAPLLDESLAALSSKDRNAVLLRFFEKKSFGEIGATLGGNENSARVRVARAVEKLRRFFQRRGVTVSAAALSGALLTNAVQAAPAAVASSLAGCGTVPGQTTVAILVQAVLRRLLWRRVLRVGTAIAVLLFLAGAGTLAIQQRQAAQTAALADAARSVRNLMIAIDRTYTLNDPNGFVALIHLQASEGEQFRPVLADYVRAQSSFRREMRRAFNVQQRTFDATFRELCVTRPLLTNYIRMDRAVTNIMTAKYPVHFVKTGDTWKWDLFDGLTREARERRIAILRHKTAVLDRLAGQVRDGWLTNVTEILETVRNAQP
jgi:RNA polymerase sigma factor (sigma-70 family)